MIFPDNFIVGFGIGVILTEIITGISFMFYIKYKKELKIRIRKVDKKDIQSN